MELRLPGGSSLLDGLFDSSGSSTLGASGSSVLDPSPAQVTEAISALAAGHVEFVGLDDPIGSLQTAERPGGGYVLERMLAGSDSWTELPFAVTLEQLHAAFLAFREGDVTAGGAPWPIEPPPTEKSGRRWFRRG